MDVVAVRTCHLVDLVLAAVPVGARPTFVTGETRAVSGFRRRWGLWPGIRLQRPGLDGSKIDVHLIYGTLQVVLARSVAVPATGRSRIASHTHLGLIDREHRRWPGFVMAEGAHPVSFRRFIFRRGRVGGQAGSSHAEAENEYTQGQQLLQVLHLFSPYLGGSRS